MSAERTAWEIRNKHGLTLFAALDIQDAIKAATARPAPAFAPLWTTSLPTVPGWYWVRGVLYNPQPTMAEVTEDSACLAGWEWGEPLSSKEYFSKAEWYGPIEVPA